ncbi:MAG: hypothetical protein ACXVHU_03755 [Methanobacterium sp.]
MSIDPIEDILEDPDNRAKLYLFLTVGMIVSTFLIIIGTIIFILRLVGIIHI